jgi:hypothetical protein
MSTASSPLRQRASRSYMQCGSRDTITARRGRSSEKRTCTCMSNSAATSAKAAGSSSRPIVMPVSENSTRWKKMPASASVCCSAWTMFPPWR